MSDEIRKHREFTYGNFTGHVQATRPSDGTVLASDRKVPIRAYGDQTTWSRETIFPRIERLKAHARARGRRSRFHDRWYDFGSNFLSVKRSYDDDGAINRPVKLTPVYWVGSRYGYEGPLVGFDPSSGGPFGRFPTYSDSALRDEMLKFGTTAIANTIPTNPSVGVGTLIGESVERLPSLPGAAILGRPGNVSKKFADEYLNYEFALKPLISDVQGIAQTVKDTNRILEQLERDSGRLVRRRYTLPTEVNISRLVDENRSYTSYPNLATRQYGDAGRYTVIRKTEKRMWFSGAYTYHYSQGSDLWSKLKRAEQHGNKLFGLRLSPSLVWELSPWSWAADWVTNAGDVLSNISALSRDGLVLKWGYVMCDLKITDTHSLRINLRDNESIRSTQSFTTHVKKRVRATPYGFGLDPDWKDFSTRQLAILGALGITRGR